MLLHEQWNNEVRESRSKAANSKAYDSGYQQQEDQLEQYDDPVFDDAWDSDDAFEAELDRIRLTQEQDTPSIDNITDWKEVE